MIVFMLMRIANSVWFGAVLLLADAGLGAGRYTQRAGAVRQHPQTSAPETRAERDYSVLSMTVRLPC